MIEMIKLLLFNKRAFVTSPIDLLKGLFVGFIVGVILVYLLAKGVLSWWDVCGLQSGGLQ